MHKHPLLPHTLCHVFQCLGQFSAHESAGLIGLKILHVATEQVQLRWWKSNLSAHSTHCLIPALEGPREESSLKGHAKSVETANCGLYHMDNCPLLSALRPTHHLTQAIEQPSDGNSFQSLHIRAGFKLASWRQKTPHPLLCHREESFI